MFGVWTYANQSMPEYMWHYFVLSSFLCGYA